MTTILNLVYDQHQNRLNLYLPDAKQFDTVVYFHGGGLEKGDKSDPCYVENTKVFVQNGFGFVSVFKRKHSLCFPVGGK